MVEPSLVVKGACSDIGLIVMIDLRVGKYHVALITKSPGEAVLRL